MILSFATKELRSICEDQNKAKHTFSPDIAIKLQNRLADIIAADCVAEVVFGNPQELDNNCYKVNLSQGYVIIFCSSHTTTPMNKGGLIDWSKVSRVKILDINHE